MARILEQRGESLAALELYATALDECPRREDVHRSIIRLYFLLGRVDQAREQYHVLEGVYQKLGIQPSRESLELLRTIESSGAKPSR
jgi:DNA-binding SARP family transcriptional activator